MSRQYICIFSVKLLPFKSALIHWMCMVFLGYKILIKWTISFCIKKVCIYWVFTCHISHIYWNLFHVWYLYYRDIPLKSVLCDNLEHELKCRSRRRQSEWSNLQMSALNWHRAWIWLVYPYSSMTFHFMHIYSLIYDWFCKYWLCVSF